jgi:hypothetical protein
LLGNKGSSRNTCNKIASPEKTVRNMDPALIFLLGTLFMTVIPRELRGSIFFENYLLEIKAPNRNMCDKISSP